MCLVKQLCSFQKHSKLEFGQNLHNRKFGSELYNSDEIFNQTSNMYVNRISDIGVWEHHLTLKWKYLSWFNKVKQSSYFSGLVVLEDFHGIFWALQGVVPILQIEIVDTRRWNGSGWSLVAMGNGWCNVFVTERKNKLKNLYDFCNT